MVAAILWQWVRGRRAPFALGAIGVVLVAASVLIEGQQAAMWPAYLIVLVALVQSLRRPVGHGRVGGDGGVLVQVGSMAEHLLDGHPVGRIPIGNQHRIQMGREVAEQRVGERERPSLHQSEHGRGHVGLGVARNPERLVRVEPDPAHGIGPSRRNPPAPVGRAVAGGENQAGQLRPDRNEAVGETVEPRPDRIGIFSP